VIVEIQCLPRPPGTAGDRYAHVRTAIGVIEASGLTYEVGALGTTVEGAPEEVWPLLRRVHEAALGAGAESVVTVVKLLEAADDGDGPTMASLTDRYRS
jgi:uncharacterized protein YqgV (UPF0045/DUF77 family)